MNRTLVSVVFINCNRLFYLKSCIESFLLCTDDYEEKEIIVVDNASSENGTSEYLSSLESRGYSVFRRAKRDPANEFAHALNIGASESNGQLVFLIQGDTQFVVKGGWLLDYVNLFKSSESEIGCVMLDAQRSLRNNSSGPFSKINTNSMFLFDEKRNPVNCAGDSVYSRSVLNKIGPWRTMNGSHEGGNDSETDMLMRVADITKNEKLRWKCVVPIIPPSVGIFTDARGTMARVRGNRRYGDYWPPKSSDFYYEILCYEDLRRRVLSQDVNMPISIEQLAKPIGFKAPLDGNGNWLKNPIRPETAGPSDYIEICDSHHEAKQLIGKDQAFDEWLSDD